MKGTHCSSRVSRLVWKSETRIGRSNIDVCVRNCLESLYRASELRALITALNPMRRVLCTIRGSVRGEIACTGHVPIPDFLICTVAAGKVCEAFEHRKILVRKALVRAN